MSFEPQGRCSSEPQGSAQFRKGANSFVPPSTRIPTCFFVRLLAKYPLWTHLPEQLKNRASFSCF